MPADVGSQSVIVKYFDPVNSASIANKIALDVRKLGIYSGGYLTKVSDVSVSLSALACEIGDGTYQVRASTGAAVTVAISVAAPVIVLRWTYTGSASADYMDFANVATNAVLATDIVVGKGTFVGSTLQSTFDYSTRTNPDVHNLFLKVEPTVAASMAVRIRGGKINYGTTNYDIADQLSSTFTAPVSGSRIDVIAVTTAGAIAIISGTPATTPTAPSYAGQIALAEITIPTGSTSITASMIKDVRGFISAGYVQPSGAVVAMQYVEDATAKSVTGGWAIDTSVPQISEGTDYTELSIAYALSNSANYIILELLLNGVSHGIDAYASGGIFRSDSTNVLVIGQTSHGQTGGEFNAVVARCKYAPGDTTSRTYTVRMSCYNGSMTVNTKGYYGGTLLSSFKLTEVKA